MKQYDRGRTGPGGKGNGKMLKRLLSVLLALCVLAGLVSAGAEESLTVSYDFDMRIHLEEREVPFRMRERLQAYRDMLDTLELKGNVVWNPKIWGMDIHLELIPGGNPSAAVQLRIFGRGSSICVESPLLGEEPYYLGQTSRIMGFASQLWTTLGLPLPAFFLADPFIIPYVLKDERNAWRKAFPKIAGGQEISAGQLETLRDTWQRQLQEDEKLKNWLNGFYCLAENPEIVQQAVAALPETLVKAAGGGSLAIREADGALVCENEAGESVFTVREEEQAYTVEFCPPDAGEGYRPYGRFSRKQENGTGSLAVEASLNRSESVPQAGENNGENEYGEAGIPDSMLRFSLAAEGIPAAWPADGTMAAKLSMGGYTLPAADLDIRLETAKDGSVKLAVSEAAEDGNGPGILTCTGSVKQAPYEGELYYEYGDLFEHTLLLVATHDWVTEALGQILPNMMNGLINFVYELPVRSCQVLLDDLERIGLLGAVLAGN